MQDGEIEFPFDISSFMKKAVEMEKAITTTSGKMELLGKTISKSVSKGVMVATAKIKLLVNAFKAVGKNMPEIGQTFKMVSDIMSKEFFFPIRQQIMPYLQKMLDWTRDHRALFAKWGTTVAGVFKTVITVGKELFQIIKNITTTLVNSLQKSLGTSFKSLDDFMNVLAVKLTVVAILIKDAMGNLLTAITPTFEYIITVGAKVLGFFTDLISSWMELNENGNSLQTVLNKMFGVFDKIVRVIGDALTSFFEGLVEPLKKLMTPLDELFESFDRLLSVFGDDNAGIKGMFKWLGGFVGNTLLVAFEELAWAVGTIVDGIMTLVKAGQLIGDIFSGNWEAMSAHASEVGDIWSAWLARTNATGERQLNALVEGVTGGAVSTEVTSNPQAGRPIKMKFGNEWVSRTYEYNGKIGAYDSWSNDLGVVLPTKDGTSYYRYRRDNAEEMAILEEVRSGNYTRMHDGFISKDGQIVKLDPDDNIYAFKRLSNLFPKAQKSDGYQEALHKEITNINRTENSNSFVHTFTNNWNNQRRVQNVTAPMNMTFNVTVTEGNAEQAGRNLGMAIQQSFVDRLKMQQMAEGF